MIDSSPTWMTPIINYLLNGQLPNDKNEAQKLLYSVPRYTIIEGKLYKEGTRCLYFGVFSLQKRMKSSKKFMKAFVGTMQDTIKKKLDAAKGKWVDELPQVLWAHRTTEKTITGHTPFSLAFGSEEMLPVKVNISTHRREFYNQEENQELLKLSLDLLDEKRAESQITNAAYQHRVTR
ncbi:uncharacterized protein LOC133031407 [Cannabis sativa]|uniref:uncharacterized protein LOC133031407 n=1 Tax=Cannabis sativa TaxID=3483 RepID=UPI0029CA2EBC|nr:uncharacterized protein LOC133031407 [Cannabis sativa]